MTIENIISFSWPGSQLDKALSILAFKAGFIEKQDHILPIPKQENFFDDNFINQWADKVSVQLGMEILNVKTDCSEIREMLGKAAPAVIRLETGELPRFLAVLKITGKKVLIIKPDQNIHKVSLETIHDFIIKPFKLSLSGEINELLDKAGVPQARLKETREAFLNEQLRGKYFGGIWMLRMPPGSNFRQQLDFARIPSLFAAILGSHLLVQIILVISWWIIGRQALEGYFAQAPVMAWALLLISIIPVNFLNIWAQNRLSLDMGQLFKQRLLCGILKLEPEEIRHKGTGQFMNMVMETDLMSTFATEGGLTAIIAVIELFIAAGILAAGAGGFLHALMLLNWIIFGAWMCYRYYLKARTWIDSYQEMSNDLIEKMLGYRTRLVQEDPKYYHEHEKELLQNYLADSEKLDNLGLYIRAATGRGWLVTGLWGIFPAFFSSTGFSGPGEKAGLAISIGGLLMASQALTQMTSGILNFIRIFTAWEQVKPLFQAAARMGKNNADAENILPDKSKYPLQQPLISFCNLTFKYEKGGTSILDSCTQDIYQGNQIILKGNSGQGKSTLASVLAGQRFPGSGNGSESGSGDLLLWGTDHSKISPNLWQTCVSAAPQSHENHILTETLAFNLLMGAAWPPSHEDIETAEKICYELGLGELLEKMPGGMYQMIGESGWCLSHGERTRVFIARALLGKGDMKILDENFAVLDPDNFTRVIKCILKHSSTVLIITNK